MKKTVKSVDLTSNLKQRRLIILKQRVKTLKVYVSIPFFAYSRRTQNDHF